jgi:hypothetical protein
MRHWSRSPRTSARVGARQPSDRPVRAARAALESSDWLGRRYGSVMEASAVAIAPPNDLRLSRRSSICGRNPQMALSRSAPRALSKQEVAGSIPAGSTAETPANDKVQLPRDLPLALLCLPRRSLMEASPEGSLYGCAPGWPAVRSEEPPRMRVQEQTFFCASDSVSTRAHSPLSSGGRAWRQLPMLLADKASIGVGVLVGSGGGACPCRGAHGYVHGAGGVCGSRYREL